MWFIGFNKWSSEKQPALEKDKTRNGPAEGAKKKKSWLSLNTAKKQLSNQNV